MGLSNMVSELLTGRLDEHRLFPEVRGKKDVGLGMASKVALEKLPNLAMKPLSEV